MGLGFVYSHTGEGNERGPTLCFRGIDNPTYYGLTGPLSERTTPPSESCAQLIKNPICCPAVSSGTPMVLGGDEDFLYAGTEVPIGPANVYPAAPRSAVVLLGRKSPLPSCLRNPKNPKPIQIPRDWRGNNPRWETGGAR